MKPSVRFAGLLALALLCLAGAWQSTRLAQRYRGQIEAQPAVAALWKKRIDESHLERADLDRRLAELRARTPPAPSQKPVQIADTIDRVSEIAGWVQRVRTLQRAFAAHPDQHIPELSLLGEQDWLLNARHVSLDSDDNRERAFAILRNSARSRFVQWLLNAMNKHTRTHDGRLPVDTESLRPYFSPTLDPAIFDEYEIVRSGRLAEAPPGPVLTLKNGVSSDYDARVTINREVDGSLTYSTHRKSDPTKPEDEAVAFDQQIHYDVNVAVRAFLARNNGTLPKTPAELVPYFDPPIGPALIQMFSRPLSPEMQKQFEADMAARTTTGKTSR